MKMFLFLIIVIPAAEIGVLMFSGNMIGLFPTIMLILVTGILGTLLAKKQGLQTVRRVQEQLQYGRLPGDEILDGICILVGGVLLLTPGFITDIFGIFFLLPPTRNFIKPLIMKMFQRWINKNTITVIR